METLGRSRQTRSHQRPPSGLEERHPSPPEKLDEAGGDEDESENRRQKKPSCLKHFIPKQNNSQMAQVKTKSGLICFVIFPFCLILYFSMNSQSKQI